MNPRNFAIFVVVCLAVALCSMPRLPTRILASPAPQIQNHLDSLAPGQWFSAPNSKVQAVMYQFPSGTFFGNTTNMRFFVESGGSYDSTRNRMIVWGGGHQDYAGNEIYTFDIGTLSWSSVNNPSAFLDSNGTIENSGYYPDGSGNPDHQQPRSRHSYWYQL